MGRIARLLVFASCFAGLTTVRAAGPSPTRLDWPAEHVDFERHVAPLLSRYGCNVGSCHGSAEGKGGFKLSLFGFDMTADYAAITDVNGSRIDLSEPDLSLLLLKPALQTDHGGGKRFSEDSVAGRTIRRWIAEGAEHRPGSGTLRSVECVPNRTILSPDKLEIRPKVIATFADGTHEDVTEYCEFRSQDETVASLDEAVIRRAGPGDTHVIAVYRGYPAGMAVLSPNTDEATADGTSLFAQYRANNQIDHLIVQKLQILGIEPSPLADDVEFLRRVSLAAIGQLPAPAEIRQFVADTDQDKWARKIDTLLSHPLHAALWATRMCEITGSRDLGSARMRDSDNQREWSWHAWFRKRFADNVPYDEMVRDILCATTLEGREFSDYVDCAAQADELSDDIDALSEHYAERRTLDLFWRRPKVNEDLDVEELAERVSAAFLGVRIECAKCHKHPFDRWTQDDHRSLTNVFTQVKLGLSPRSRSAMVDLLKDQREARRKGLPTETIPAVQEVFISTSPHDKLGASSQTKLAPRPLGAQPIPRQGDRREAFAVWLTDTANPMFARNFVNRVWQWYFGRGLVEPVDAFSAANPPSHPKLLDTLADEFIRSGFDVRRLERMILTSRTWQQSSISTKTNASDERNFARAYVIPLRAESLVDAVQSATGSSFGKVELARQELPAVAIPVGRTGNPQLDTWFSAFQRPERKLTCDCEQNFEPTLRQTMLLLSDPDMLARIREGSLVDMLAQDPSNEELVEELFLRSLSRWPDKRECLEAMNVLDSTGDRLAAAADLLWSLMNTREFVTNH